MKFFREKLFPYPYLFRLLKQVVNIYLEKCKVAMMIVI